jgi:hypothetical protein
MIIEVILGTIFCIIPLIFNYFWTHSKELDGFRKAMQILWIKLTKHSLTIGKCTTYFLMPLFYIYMCGIQAHKVVFTPDIYTSIGNAFVLFMVVTPIIFLIIFVIEPFVSDFLRSKAPK